MTRGYLQDPDPQLIEMFRAEAAERLDALDEGLASESPDLDALRREAHTLNGAGSMVGLPDIAELAADMERELADATKTGSLSPERAKALRAEVERIRSLASAP